MLKRLLGLLAVTAMLSACAFVGNYPRDGESEPPIDLRCQLELPIDAEWRGSVIGLVFYFGGDADLNITYVYLRTNSVGESSAPPTPTAPEWAGTLAQPS